jgi:hypothetical protein
MHMTDAKQLTDMLRDAEIAHAAYEEGLGHPDVDWPVWYAKFMAEAMNKKVEEPSFVQGNIRSHDFTPAGNRIEGQYENDRNADSKALFRAIMRECLCDGQEMDVIIGHHLVYELREKRGDGFTYEISEEIPSADTLIFDHTMAKKLWGDQWKEKLTQLACEPVETRDQLLAKLYYGRTQAKAA